MSEVRSGWGDATWRLLRLLAQRERSYPGWPPPPAWDWRTFAETCDQHKLAPFVYRRLQQLTKTIAPPELGEYLRARFHETCVNNYYLASQLVSLVSRLESEGISVLAFKGPSLAMAVYGGLSLRQCLDLDLLIHKDQLVKGADLMNGWGFEPKPTPARPQVMPYLCRPENPRDIERGKEIEFLSPDGTFYVDLHWQLGDRFWRPFAPEVERLWQRSVKQQLPTGSVSTPCREDLFLALCAHGTRHRWMYLRWLLDVAELLRKPGTLDWSRIEEMTIIRPGARAAASLAVILARDLLEVPIPAEASQILAPTRRTSALAIAIREELLLHGRTSGDEHTTLLALEQRPLARMSYHAERIIRYPESLFRQIIVEVGPKDRRLVRLPLRLQFLYYVIRPLRLVVSHFFQATRRLWRLAA